ncbi:molybdopterin molybdotransferase MoeA [Campylobacter suis]|uniref:Molybdopterin molybdenumtransferase n=1 Tax=Campylobacter suis TaxID=2790657 RepID=A0ABM8Q2P4_9BACT|nr:molybdopterin molybdotransferase MoeA [Campylobacter suis]CAD7287042.1 Molybdopterin molybdenumtransferase [Campylobacter suis]
MKVEFEQAKEILRQNFNIKASKIVPIEVAVGEILADDILAIKNLPAFDNSALDGYAVIYDNKEDGYELIDSIFAGEKKQLSISGNQCVKIMTGALFPKGADTVIRLEDAIIKDGKIYANEKLKKGEAHRFCGEEIKAGELLIEANTKLTAAHIMLLASQGISHISILNKPSIAIFSSGDELKEPWQSADDFEIYNANAYGIGALLKEKGLNFSYKGIIKDKLQDTIEALRNAQNFDVIFCSGGASKGEADYMKDALIKLGYKELFEHINIRPGGPCKAFAKDKKIVFILPGNPMAAFLCAMLLALPLISGTPLQIQTGKICENIKFKQGRSNIVFCNINENGEISVTDGNKFGSGMITPIIKSNAIYLSQPHESELLKDSLIKILKIS